MSNKQDLQNQYNKLEKEMLILKEKINKVDKIDLFTIITYDQVCNYLQEDKTCCPYQQIKQLERCFNQDWIKDMKNTNQKKWYPYFSCSDSGFSFDDSDCIDDLFHGSAGLYKDEKTSSHIGKYFKDIYEKLANS